MNKKNQLIKRFITSVLLLATSFQGITAELQGKIALSDGWRSVVYLSQLNSFDDLNTASYHLLIAEAKIDPDGSFNFGTINIPTYDQLYRLHICKNDDPVSTIIIGGQEQNHLHFLMNNSSLIQADILSFHDFSIEGHSENKTLQELFDLKRRINAPLDIPSDQNRKLHKDNIKNQIIRIAEETNSDAVRILSLHFLQKSFDIDEYEWLIEKLQSKFTSDSDSSPYYYAYQEQVQLYNYSRLEKSSTPNFLIPWYFWLFIPIGGILFYFLVYKKPKKEQSDPSHLLSIQEKRVYELLCLGKSNKEISMELNIEVSTVKSHVYKIFSKLDVKSRKELFS